MLKLKRRNPQNKGKGFFKNDGWKNVKIKTKKKSK